MYRWGDNSNGVYTFLFLALVGHIYEWLLRIDHIPTPVCLSSAIDRQAHINTHVRDAKAWDVNL